MRMKIHEKPCKFCGRMQFMTKQQESCSNALRRECSRRFPNSRNRHELTEDERRRGRMNGGRVIGRQSKERARERVRARISDRLKKLAEIVCLSLDDFVFEKLEAAVCDIVIAERERGYSQGYGVAYRAIKKQEKEQAA